jgi:hypothetical protein
MMAPTGTQSGVQAGYPQIEYGLAYINPNLRTGFGGGAQDFQAVMRQTLLAQGAGGAEANMYAAPQPLARSLQNQRSSLNNGFPAPAHILDILRGVLPVNIQSSSGNQNIIPRNTAPATNASMPNTVARNPSVAQANPQTSNAGYQLLDQGLQSGQITFDRGDEQTLYNYLGEALNRSPTMRRDFARDLNEGNTYSFGYRTTGGSSFATLNTNSNRIEFNERDLLEIAPYGPYEVAYHELSHSIFDLDHGTQHNNYIRSAINEAGLTRVR